MMTITLSPMVYDGSPPVRLFLSGNSDPLSAERRVTRTRMLDGGVTVYDGGYAAGDRTINCSVVRPTEFQVYRVKELLELYGEVTATLDDGVFKAYLGDYRYFGGRLQVSVLIVADMSIESV